MFIKYSNMTSFFCFVDKRVIYRWYNLIRTCAGECDWFSGVNVHVDELSSARIWQHKLCDNELNEGIDVVDDKNNVIGTSKVAAKKVKLNCWHLFSKVTA
jgi:hypothetical protein